MSNLQAIFMVVPIAVSCCAANAIAEKTNQKDVRKSLGKDGWEVAYGTMFTEGDWLEAAGSVVATYYSANPAPIEEWVRNEVDRNYAKIAPQVENLALADLKNMCIKSIREGKLYRAKNVQVEVSIATYKRWEEWKHPSLDLKTGKYRNVTEKTKYPNWHQLYLRYRIIPNGNNQPTPITAKYAEPEARKWLGTPVDGTPGNAERMTPDHVGRFVRFQHGSIYWSPSTGAHEIHGLIADKWANLKWEAGFLGYPTTDELYTPDKTGGFSHFQGGSIYWSPQTGAHEVHGAIRDKWASLGWEKSALGYPTSDERATTDGKGRVSHFQDNYSIEWRPTTGAVVKHPTSKGIRPPDDDPADDN